MLPLPCMLVCIFVCANRTRDCGCSKHPVFPAPSLLEEGNQDANLGRNAPRDRESVFRRMGGAKRYPSPHAPALMGIAALHLRDCMTRTECRIFLQCSKAIKMAPANGQWQFSPLLCIGATGIQ